MVGDGELLRKIKEAEEDIKKGRVRRLEEFLKEIGEYYRAHYRYPKEKGKKKKQVLGLGEGF